MDDNKPADTDIDRSLDNRRMKIERAYPPNIDAILQVFPNVKQTRGVLFAWDMTIFNPDDIVVSSSLDAHEQVHSIQQKGNPEAWWAKYLTAPVFRYEQEVIAHISEYAVAYGLYDRNGRRHQLNQIAARLAGPLYGSLTTKSAALRLIKTEASRLLAATNTKA
jgi:hypothetical protein